METAVCDGMQNNATSMRCCWYDKNAQLAYDKAEQDWLCTRQAGQDISDKRVT